MKLLLLSVFVVAAFALDPKQKLPDVPDELMGKEALLYPKNPFKFRASPS